MRFPWSQPKKQEVNQQESGDSRLPQMEKEVNKRVIKAARLQLELERLGRELRQR